MLNIYLYNNVTWRWYLQKKNGMIILDESCVLQVHQITAK